GSACRIPSDRQFHLHATDCGWNFERAARRYTHLRSKCSPTIVTSERNYRGKALQTRARRPAQTACSVALIALVALNALVAPVVLLSLVAFIRSEERRVGKECRFRGWGCRFEGIG